MADSNTDYVIVVDEPGERIDRFLAGRLQDLSRSRIQRLIDGGQILVNAQPVRSSYTPQPGDRITVELPPQEPIEPRPEPIPLDMVYEDDHLMVVNKPAGMVVHLGPGHTEETLVNALLYHRPELAEVGMDSLRPGIVHRLDRDTSGLLVVAKQPDALRALQRQFRQRQVDKVYLALVYGHPAPSEAAIEAPIARDPRDRQRMAIVAKGGHYARSEYLVKEMLPEAALLEVRILTGRTHQIRVHLAAIGYPVVGDETYGRRNESIRAPRQMLHAWRLGFSHPNDGEPLSFQVDPPDDMQRVLRRLRNRQR